MIHVGAAIRANEMMTHATATRSWTLRVVFPSHLPWLGEPYQEHARQELAKPWPQLIERIKWYFQQRTARNADFRTCITPDRIKPPPGCTSKVPVPAWA